MYQDLRSVEGAAGDFSEITRVASVRPASLVGDVLVPLCQAVLSGVLIGAPLGWLVGRWLGLAAGCVLVVGVAWLVLLVDHRSLLRVVETVVGRDLDKDGSIGKPESVRLDVQVSDDGGRVHVLLVDLPGSLDALKGLARGVLAGRSFSESEWAGGGRSYTVKEFRQLRGELVARGLALWRNPRAPAQGVVLAPVGRSVFRSLADGDGQGQN